MPPLLPVTRALLLVNVAVFFLQKLLGADFIRFFALLPLGDAFLPWQVVTYAFLHEDGWQLFFNMWGLWLFGSELERVWGEKRFLQYYFASVLAAALTPLVVFALLAPGYGIGSSGGIYGLLLGYAMVFPNRTILLFFAIPMRARWLALLYGVLELYQGIFATSSGVRHFASLGGMLGGLLMIRYWRGQIPFGRRR